MAHAMSATSSKSIIQFLRWIHNILISRRRDGNLLEELSTLKTETQEAQKTTFLISFILISTTLIALVSYLSHPALAHKFS